MNDLRELNIELNDLESNRELKELKKLKELYPKFVFGKFDYPTFFTKQSLLDPKYGYAAFEYTGPYDEILPKPYFTPCSEDEKPDAVALYGETRAYDNIPIFVVAHHTGEMFNPPDPKKLDPEIIMPILFKIQRDIEEGICTEYDESTEFFLKRWEKGDDLGVQYPSKLWYVTFGTYENDFQYIKMTVSSGAEDITKLFENEDFVKNLNEYNEWELSEW